MLSGSISYVLWILEEGVINFVLDVQKGFMGFKMVGFLIYGIQRKVRVRFWRYTMKFQYLGSELMGYWDQIVKGFCEREFVEEFRFRLLEERNLIKF